MIAMLGRNRIVVVFAALAVGGAAGWLAAVAWGKCKCVNVKVCKCENVETVNGGRARSPSAPNGRARRPATADAAAEKPKVTAAELAALRTKAAGASYTTDRRRGRDPVSARASTGNPAAAWNFPRARTTGCRLGVRR